MANRKEKKVPFRRSCFEEALELRNTSIRKLGNVTNGIGWSEKTIRRGLEEHKISPILLDEIAKRLDVDPDYLSGRYHEEAERCSDPTIQKIWLHNLKAEKYPYLLVQQRDRSDGRFIYDRYLENILVIHNISLNQFKVLPFDKQKNMQVELENAICQVLLQYFKKDASGRDTYPEIYHLQSDIEDYDPDFVEPPEEFFEEMIREDDYK